MKQWSIAVVAAAFGLACICAQAAEPVPIEAFADTDQVTSPRISPDGKHVAVSANLGGGNHAIVVYQVDDMQQTAPLKLPPYEQPAGMHWASHTRPLVPKGRLVGPPRTHLAPGRTLPTHCTIA